MLRTTRRVSTKLLHDLVVPVPRSIQLGEKRSMLLRRRSCGSLKRRLDVAQATVEIRSKRANRVFGAVTESLDCLAKRTESGDENSVRNVSMTLGHLSFEFSVLPPRSQGRLLVC